MIITMEEDYLNGYMFSNMMDNGKMIRKMEEGSKNGLMVDMMENGKIIRKMAQEF